MPKERMSLKRFIDRYITAGAEAKTSVTCEVEGSQLKLGDVTPVAIVGTSTSAGVLYGNSATGTLPVTEASAASIYNYATYAAQAQLALHPFFSLVDPTSTAQMQNGRYRTALVTLVTDGSGNCAATTVVPAVSGYTGHANIYGLTSTVADAAGTYTWAVAAGTILGPSVFTMQVAANQFTFFSAAVPNVAGTPLPIRGTVAADDNKAITLAITNGAATSTHWVYVEYWYET